MKRLNSTLTLAICLSALLAVSLACSGSVTTNTTTSNNAAANSATNTTTPTASTPAPSTPKNIAGEYDANGTNPDSGGTYKAALTITPREDVFQFSWKSGKNDYDGVGVLQDSAVAVAFTDGKNGDGCGVVLYKVNSDGSLDGKVGYWGVNKMETEKAVRKSGTDLEGEYEITGKNPDGQEYKGKLNVKKEGLGYAFNWSAPDTLEGFGIQAGNLVAVGFGGKQCSFVGYDIKPDGTLDGKWGFKTSKTLGTEVAKKK
ncbi:MAG TPA: hypothetical protein PLP21_10985 [Pyrinomonadaceae bacterium]|nr:hypothetical protein [Acidobacteriota bacterium]HQZ96832.1 hypothetical protein [Pyrinomonadaceae bacterium]